MDQNPYKSPSSSVEHKLPFDAHNQSSMETIYRILIAVSFISYMLYFYQPYNTSAIYDQSTLDVLAWSGYGANEALIRLIPWLMLFLSAVVAVGLWFYLNFARILYLILILSILILSPFLGLSVNSGIDNFLGYIVNLLDGVVLYMSFFSSASKKFAMKS